MKSGTYMVYSKDLSWHRIVKVLEDGSALLGYSNDKPRQVRVIRPDKFSLMVDGWNLQQLYIERI